MPQQNATDELSSNEVKTTEDIQKAIKELRTVIQEDKHLMVRDDDSFLLNWLYVTNFDIEAAYKRMVAYYKLKADNPTWFASSGPESIRDLIEENAKVLLDDRDREGRRVLVTRLGKMDPGKRSLPEIACYDEMLVYSILEEPQTQKSGLACIVDLKGCPWKIFRWMTPHNLRVGTQKAEIVPLSDLHYHVVNTSTFLNAAIAMVFPFLSAYTKSHVHFHYDNWASLHEFIDPEVLPIEYGGTQLVDADQSYKKFLFDRSDIIANNFKCHYKS